MLEGKVARFFLVALASIFVACGGSGPPTTKVVSVTPASSSSAIATDPAEISSGDADAIIPVAPDDPQRGDPNAYVTIVVFTDFQCPFCGRLVPTLAKIHEEYPNDVRIVFKNEPLSFHQHARYAAEVGAGIMATRGADAFWRFHDLAFAEQGQIDQDAIVRWAMAVGAGDDVRRGIAAHTWASKVDRDQALADKVGAHGTPTSFINGTEIGGAQPYEKFKEVVDVELAKAKALEASGVARKALYTKLALSNFKAPAQEHAADDDDDKEDTKTVWKVPVGASPVRGGKNALVTIVEFSDFQCPYCQRVEATLDQVRKDYGDKVRIVWKDSPLPFHPRALPAAKLARFARTQKGDLAFWTAHDKLFAKSPTLEDGALEAVAKDLGLDARSAIAAANAKTTNRAIEDDQSLADDVQATGTPHFFINGRRLVGAQPYEKFKSIIDEEIVTAGAIARRTPPPASIYDELVKDGKAPPEPEKKVVPANTHAPFRGPSNASVVIQEFSDFQCPFCSRAEPTLADLMNAYPGKIKIVWRDRPLAFHRDAALAAEAAHEAFVQKGNEGFSKMRELLFAHQSDPDGLKRAALDSYAATLGLDAAKFAKALDTHAHKAAIDAESKVADDASISGTPAFTVGPYFISGAQPIAKFKKLVERTLHPPPAAPLPKGLVTQDITMGSGVAAKAGDTLEVHYTGTLTDGTVFDSSRPRGQTFKFKLGGGQVIKGWDQGLVGMKIGGRRKLTIPPDLAYGDRGAVGKIPPGATLLFDVELVGIK